MKTRTVTVLIAIAMILGFAGYAFSVHEDERGTSKGVITKVEAIELELTVKDEKGAVNKVKTKDSTLKVGDRVVIKNGKVTKEVRPITGGY